MDPMTLLGLLSAGQSLLGQKQLGGIAPPVNLGGPMSGMSMLASQNNFGKDPIQEGKSVAEAAAPMPSGLLGENNPALKALNATNQQPSGLGGFFGNLDDTLGSQSKVLGLGLLGQLDPRLGLAGLLAGGLLGKNKVFK